MTQTKARAERQRREQEIERCRRFITNLGKRLTKGGSERHLSAYAWLKSRYEKRLAELLKEQ